MSSARSAPMPRRFTASRGLIDEPCSLRPPRTSRSNQPTIVTATTSRSQSDHSLVAIASELTAAASGERPAVARASSPATMADVRAERPKTMVRSWPGVPWILMGTPKACTCASTEGPGPLTDMSRVSGPSPVIPNRLVQASLVALTLALNVLPPASTSVAIAPASLTVAPLTTHWPCPWGTSGVADGEGLVGDGVTDAGLEAICGLTANAVTAPTQIAIADARVTVRVTTSHIHNLACDDALMGRLVAPTLPLFRP